MRKQHAIAYLVAALCAALSPMMVLALLGAKSWQGMASVRGLVSLGIVALALAFAYFVPLAALLRRLLLFRAPIMGVAGFVPAAALMAFMVIGTLVQMPDGSVVPMSWADIVLGSAFYGSLGGGGGVVFHFVFRAIAGGERLVPGGTIDA